MDNTRSERLLELMEKLRSRQVPLAPKVPSGYILPEEYASEWSSKLLQLVSELQHELRMNKCSWEKISKSTGLSVQTIKRITGGWKKGRNPCICTLIMLSNALQYTSGGEEHAK